MSGQVSAPWHYKPAKGMLSLGFLNVKINACGIHVAVKLRRVVSGHGLENGQLSPFVTARHVKDNFRRISSHINECN